ESSPAVWRLVSTLDLSIVELDDAVRKVSVAVVVRDGDDRLPLGRELSMTTTRLARTGHSEKSSRRSWPSRIALVLAMAALAVLPQLRGSWHHGVLLLLVFIALEPAVLGFDTGHHADLTREVLHEAGFGETSIRVA